MANSVEQIVNAWHRFHQEALLAQNYRMAPRAPGVITTDTTPNPVVERLLPSLLFVRVTSILDEALELYIDQNHVEWPTQKRKDFKNRIEVLADNSWLVSGSLCHSVRTKRNDLAHDPQCSATWDELYTCVDCVEDELKNLTLIGDRPRYSWFATCTARQDAPGQTIYTLSYGRRDLSGGIPFQVTWEEPTVRSSTQS